MKRPPVTLKDFTMYLYRNGWLSDDDWSEIDSSYELFDKWFDKMCNKLNLTNSTENLKESVKLMYDDGRIVSHLNFMEFDEWYAIQINTF